MITNLLSHFWTADDDAAVRRAQLKDWLEDIGDFPLEFIQAALATWRRTQTRRPTIADIITLIRTGRAEARDQENLARARGLDQPYHRATERRPRTQEELDHAAKICADVRAALKEAEKTILRGDRELPAPLTAPLSDEELQIILKRMDQGRATKDDWRIYQEHLGLEIIGNPP